MVRNDHGKPGGLRSAIFIIICSAFMLAGRNLPACTSFVVYSKEIWYGMNFDYPETPIKFQFIREGGQKKFVAQFGTGGYVAGMNEKGLFANFQLLYYNQSAPVFKETDSALSFGDLAIHAVNNLSNVKAVKEYIGTKTLLRSWNLDLHTLFADPQGGAMVVEPFGAYTGMTPAKDGFLVMSNFPNYEFLGKDYRSVRGVGDSRYKIAYQYIKDHIRDFSYAEAWETLKRTAQSSGGYPTQVSLLFNPGKMEIYFCLKGDFSSVWKISFKDETIEKHPGSVFGKRRKIESNGISSGELVGKSVIENPRELIAIEP